jgi:hypothetical protein
MRVKAARSLDMAVFYDETRGIAADPSPLAVSDGSRLSRGRRLRLVRRQREPFP